MSRKLLRTGLTACVLTGLLAAPAHAAGGGRTAADGIWQWLLGMWVDIRMTIDPNGFVADAQSDIRGTIDPNGATTGSQNDIHGTIDPNG